MGGGAIKIKILEAYLKLQSIESRIELLMGRINSDCVSFNGAVYKDMVCYHNLLVKFINTLVALKVDGSSLLDIIVRLLINSRKEIILESLLRKDFLVDKKLNNCKLPALVEQSKRAHQLVDYLENIVSKCFADNDLL